MFFWKNSFYYRKILIYETKQDKTRQNKTRQDKTRQKTKIYRSKIRNKKKRLNYDDGHYLYKTDLKNKNKHQVIIFGSLGCGAWKNPPQHVDEIFKKVLDECHGLGL